MRSYLETKKLHGSLVRRVVLCFLFAFIMIRFECACEPVHAAGSDVRASVVQEGWEKKGNKIYYRHKGKRVSGWRKIKGKRYYFSKKTKRLLTNTIAGSGKQCFYVDNAGIRVKDPVIRQAVSFVRRYGQRPKGRMGKLKACFRYIVYNCYYRAGNDLGGSRQIPSFAKDMFLAHAGNCYRGAAALTYVAKVLGFETRMGVGGVTAYAYYNLSTHGWTEVKVDGRWYICDTSMQRHHPEANLFMVPRNEYPYRIRFDDTYTLLVRGGKVIWK